MEILPIVDKCKDEQEKKKSIVEEVLDDDLIEIWRNPSIRKDNIFLIQIIRLLKESQS